VLVREKGGHKVVPALEIRRDNLYDKRRELSLKNINKAGKVVWKSRVKRSSI
jgi:hypothetical protein